MSPFPLEPVDFAAMRQDLRLIKCALRVLLGFLSTTGIREGMAAEMQDVYTDLRDNLYPDGLPEKYK